MQSQGVELRAFITRAEEALLGRTLMDRRLERPVYAPDGTVLFRAGDTIDRETLDIARDRDRLEELAHAAEPSSSDAEIGELLWVWKMRRERSRT